MIIGGGVLRYLIIRQKVVLSFLAILLGNSIYCSEFETKIFPILNDNCIPCHNKQDKKGGLYFDNYSGVRALTSDLELVNRADPDESKLLKLISGKDPNTTMPPKGELLTPSEIQIIREWLVAGGEAPSSYDYEFKIKHWAFQIPDHDSPNHKDKSIDYFIEKSLERKGLQLSQEANRRTLYRRAHQVIIGMPPLYDEILSFINDKRQDAWDELIDKLLESHSYGENLASYWLDLVRFGETDGFETNRERPHAWHYRDWVINAFNKDMPYNDFIKYQIAGDSLNEPVGTAFLVAGPVDIVKGQDPLLGLVQRQNELDDFANTTSTTFIGLTLGCARCHDHKFDPISQKDYYAVQAIFSGVHHGNKEIYPSSVERTKLKSLEDQREKKIKRIRTLIRGNLLPPTNSIKNIEPIEGVEVEYVRFEILETKGNSEPCLDELEVYSGEKIISLSTFGVEPTSSGDFKHPLHKLSHINDGLHGNAKSWIADSSKDVWVQLNFPKPVEITKIIWSRDRDGKFSDRLPIRYRIIAGKEGTEEKTIASNIRRADSITTGSLPEFSLLATKVQGNQKEELHLLYSELKTIEKELDIYPKKASVYAGQFTLPKETRLLYRGEPDKPRGLVNPGVIESLGAIEIPSDAGDKERRLKFANWIADKSNPLTARVMVNRIWQFHFGRGLVATPNDFGRNGVPPTHPELLDWLASEFVNNGWSIKHIHKLILKSRTWKQSSKPTQDGMRLDSQGRLYWRFSPRRARAEVLRDSILKISGSLNQGIGGPGFSAFEIELENVRHYHPRKDYGPNEWRRMIYMTRVRQEKDSVFGVFDCPDGSQSVAMRTSSTTPLQALNLFNSEFVIQQAKLYSEELKSRYQENRERQINGAFKEMFGRLPSEQELELSKNLVESAGINSLTRALFNSNEFTFIY